MPRPSKFAGVEAIKEQLRHCARPLHWKVAVSDELDRIAEELKYEAERQRAKVSGWDVTRNSQPDYHCFQVVFV